MTSPTDPVVKTKADRSIATVIGLGVMLTLLLLPIRFDMMGYGIWAYLHPLYLFDLLQTAYYDVCTVGIATVIGSILVWMTRGWARSTARFLFVGFAFLVLAFALVNHQAVGMLGAPVNYQWLEYSDFLTSKDAKDALSADFSWWKVLAFAGLILVLLLGGGALRAALMNGDWRRRLIRVGVACCIAYFPFMTWWMWGNRSYYKQANGLVAFVESFLITEDPSIFTMSTDVGNGDFAVVAERKPDKAPTPTPGIKNVIFFVLESTAAEYVSTYGGKYPVTPSLERVKSRSRWFTAAYAHAPTTNKSIVSLFTSVYPWVSNHALTKKHPNNNLASLPRVLGDRGYRTAFFNSADVRHQGAGKFLKGLGFHLIEDYRTRHTDIEGFKDPDGHDLMNSSDDLATTQSLISWIKDGSAQPFFGVVWTMGTHYPYYYRGEEVDYGAPKKKWLGKIGFNRYLNAMRHADECLGQVIDTLEEHKLTDSTLVVVLGDHGEAFWQHRNRGHAPHIYEENVRVPLVFINPRLFKGTQNGSLCGVIDVAPTVLDVLGIPFPEGWQGRSLLRERKRKRIYFFSPWSHMLFGFREGNMKYIYHMREDRSRVYDLAADPHEKKNIISSLSRRDRDDIKRKLAAWAQYQARLMEERVLIKK